MFYYYYYYYYDTCMIIIITLHVCFLLLSSSGAFRFSHDIKLMIGHAPGEFWVACWMFIAPVFLAVSNSNVYCVIRKVSYNKATIIPLALTVYHDIRTTGARTIISG